ncbi:hypothetical protein EZV62_022348 [Acer yangbiense]|uniref:Uncharacterized protein n=1 Tax=Acer yangbiense TaxID=1000413 RepID=A0A5C7H8V6_9ROSI|nr:hypothetical protein EZV62_022348 [Acer yangbiense]
MEMEDSKMEEVVAYHHPCIFVQALLRDFLRCFGFEQQNTSPPDQSPSISAHPDPPTTPPHTATDPSTQEDSATTTIIAALGTTPRRPDLSTGKGPQIN